MTLSIRPLLLLVLVVFGFAVGMASLLNYFKFESTVKKLQRSRIALVAAEVGDSMEKGVAIGVSPSESTTLQPLIDRLRRADVQVLGIDVTDEAGRVLFSTEGARAGRPAPAAWVAAAGRPAGNAWFVAEPDAFVTGLVVRNSFDVPIGGVAVRYERTSLDTAVSAMGLLLAETAIATIAAGVALALLALLALFALVRRDFQAAEAVFSGNAPVAGGDEALQLELAAFRDGADAALRAVDEVTAATQPAGAQGAA